jgi:hypothetical protein
MVIKKWCEACKGRRGENMLIYPYGPYNTEFIKCNKCKGKGYEEMLININDAVIMDETIPQHILKIYGRLKELEDKTESILGYVLEK